MMRHILIVDDDPDILKALREGLQRREQAWLVSDAGNAETAIEILQRESVSLVVTDLKMPGMDGFGLMAYIMEHFPDIPVIIISGYTNPQTQKLANESGAIGYIAKPFLVSNLADKVYQSLDRETEGGTLKGVSSDVFLQLVELEGKTCTIRLRKKGSSREGILFFKDGELMDARLGNFRGNDAAYEIISWRNVSLSIQNSCPVKKRTIQEGLQAILLEAMRLKDERQAETEKKSPAIPASESQESEPVLAGPTDPLDKRLRSQIADLSGVNKISTDRSFQDIINKFNVIGSQFNSGRLKIGWFDTEEKSPVVVIPGPDPIVILSTRDCGRDHLFRSIGKTDTDLIL